MKRSLQRASGPLTGVLRVPGDKSISHRALILGAMARGKQTIEGLADGADVSSTIDCLRKLGCFVERMPDGRTMVLSRTLSGEARVDAGNSGTTARLLTGLVSGADMTCTIDGDASLRARPMERVAVPLAQMGARITLANGGTLPATISGGNLHGIEYQMPVASAQVKSAILIAGLRAEGTTRVIEPVPTRDHTERLLAQMGADIETATADRTITVRGGAALDGTRVFVPGDFSSAAFFIVAGTCIPHSDLFLLETGVNPTRTGLLRILARMGARVELESHHEDAGEPIANIVVRSATLAGTTIDDPAEVAAAIDELPVLTVAATQAEGVTLVAGAAELRRKECDRIEALTRNLSAMGARIEERDDGFRVEGPTRLTGAEVSSYGDHRIAMAMAIAGLLADGTTVVDDTSVVGVSYERFFNDLVSVMG